LLGIFKKAFSCLESPCQIRGNINGNKHHENGKKVSEIEVVDSKEE